MTEPSQSGGCLCGAVRFETAAPAHGATYCHCTRCQKRTGTAASAQAQVDGSGFRITAGEDLVKTGATPTVAGRRRSAASAARTCSAATPTTLRR